MTRGGGIAFALVVLVAALALYSAKSAGLLDPDGARRSSQIFIGLVLATYANFMPKQSARANGTVRAQSWAQSVLRVGGWSMTLAGIVYAALWAFAPLPLADDDSMAIILVAIAILLGYALWAYAACRGAFSGSAPPAR